VNEIAEFQERLAFIVRRGETFQQDLERHVATLQSARQRVEGITVMMRCATEALESRRPGDDDPRVVVVETPAILEAARIVAQEEIAYWLREFVQASGAMRETRTRHQEQMMLASEINDQLRGVLDREAAQIRARTAPAVDGGSRPSVNAGG